MIDLRNYATADLVAELCRRTGVVVHEIESDDTCEVAYQRKQNEGSPSYSFHAIPRYDGPARILVVREVE